MFEGKIGRRIGVSLVDDRKETRKLLAIERGSTRSHGVENPRWERPWTCRADNRINYFTVSGYE
jgi:hypothetical protein